MAQDKSAHKKVKVGLLGGTFNPPHYGHLILAQEAKEQFNLDKVVFMITYIPPHKNLNKIYGNLRYQMVKKAIEGFTYFEVSDLELKRKGISFTVDTLETLKNRYPYWDIHFIMGSDLMKDFFKKWRQPYRILELCHLCVAERKEVKLNKKKIMNKANLLRKKIHFFKITNIDISSSFLRERVKKKLDIRVYVPEKVADFIKKRKLYLE